MAGWNGSSATSGKAVEPPKQRRNAPSALRGVIAGAVAVVAILAAFFIFGRARTPAPKAEPEKKPAAIKEVAPAHAPKTEAPKKPVDPREDYDHTQMYRDERGHLRWNSGCRAPDPYAKKKKTLVASSLYTPSLFSNACDCAIYTLVTLKPGSPLFDDTNYYSPEFEQEFLRSLVEPVNPQPEDSAIDRELKTAVADVKKEIRERIKNGEKLGDILTEARDEFARLQKYRESLETQVSDAVEKSNGEMTTSDVKDLIAAANQMFEQQGLEPIEEDGFITWNLRLNAERNGEDPTGIEEAYEAEKELHKKEQKQNEKVKEK